MNNNIYLMVGKLSYANADYDGVLALPQYKKGVESLGRTGEEIKATSRKRRLVAARRLCCSHLRRKGWTFDRIADAVGYTNHSTVLHHVTKAEELKIYSKDFLNKHLTFIQA